MAAVRKEMQATIASFLFGTNSMIDNCGATKEGGGSGTVRTQTPPKSKLKKHSFIDMRISRISHDLTIR